MSPLGPVFAMGMKYSTVRFTKFKKILQDVLLDGDFYSMGQVFDGREEEVP